MFKKIILAMVLLIPLNVLANDGGNIPQILELKAEDAYLTRSVAAISERAHYSQSTIDNESSIKILNEYIDTLDRNKCISHNLTSSIFNVINISWMIL